MARTQTQKALRKAERSGQWCSEQSRRVNGDYGALSQHVRLMPTKQKKLQRSNTRSRSSRMVVLLFILSVRRGLLGK